MEPSGSGAEEPGKDNRIQEPAQGRPDAATSPASNAAPTAVPPPPHAPPLLDRPRRQQPGGGADGSSSSAAGADPKGKMLAAALYSAPSSSSSMAGKDARGQFDYRRVFGQLVQQQRSAIIEEEQVKSSQSKDARSSKGKEKLPQVKARPGPEKGSSLWSQLKNKIFCRDRRQIHSAHVQHQTHPVTKVMIPSNGVYNLDGYSEFRRVLGDGECFYRSFIFSYLEQVIDRQDTYEEHRILDVVERVSTEHANLGWNSFSSSSRAFKKLIKKVMKWKRQNSTDSTSSYRKEKLLKFFSTYDKTKDIFVFLRLVVAIQICSHREFYEHRIAELRGNCTLEVWCFQSVTPAHLESDHVMMGALARALEVPLKIEAVRNGYAQDIHTVPGVPRPSVTLLFTGGHYDIIYPRAPCAESSSHQASQRDHPADHGSSQQTSQREHPADQSSSQLTS